MMSTRKQIIDKIVDYFNENEDVFADAAKELDDWNGLLGEDRRQEMALLNEIYCDMEPVDLLMRAYFGRDDDSYHTIADGRRIFGSFNPNREYFYLDGYGNFVSTDVEDYIDFLDDYAIQSMETYRSHIKTIDENEELQQLFDELEEAE